MFLNGDPRFEEWSLRYLQKNPAMKGALTAKINRMKNELA